MRRVRGEQGLTLVELLAAITISAVVLSVATMTLFYVIRIFDTNTQHHAIHKIVTETSNVIASQLSDSTQAIYFRGQKELRFLTGIEYRALIHDSIEKSLKLYIFTGGQGDFLDGTITPADNTRYIQGAVLADQVEQIEYYIVDPTNGTKSLLPDEELLNNGDLLEISITFSQGKEERRTVKLLLEPAL